jgi:ATP-binding cassette subfamily F protein 3
MSTLLQIDNLSKAYGPQVIFHGASLAVPAKRKIGVIGRNGAGKTTLFKMITGREEVDSGAVNVYRQARLGYLEQIDPFRPSETVIEFLTRYTGREEWRCGKIAAQFQLKNELLDAPIDSLASGYQMRVKLAAMLLAEPNLLLLDEPTNYLDLSTQILFEQFLKKYKGGYMIISHDRELLKKVTDHILEIDRGNLFLYPGPLEEFFAYKEEQDELAEKTNLNIQRQRKHLQRFIDRFSAKATKARQAKSKAKQLQRLKTIEIVHPASTVRINIPGVAKKKGIALKINDLRIGYGESKVVARDIKFNIARGEHVAILGDNGQGKTTFLKTLAGELAPLSGSYGWMPDLKIAYYAQHVPATLDPEERVFDYLAQCADPDVTTEEVHKMAGNFLFQDSEGKKKIKVLSGGERARLCLAGLLLRKTQVLLLDEPSDHLDFETVEALANALRSSRATILFISHNRTFVNTVSTRIVEVIGGKVECYPYNYQEYVDYLERRVTDARDAPPALPRPRKKAPKTEEAPGRVDVPKEIRKQRKIIRDIEKAIESHESEKNRIDKFIADNPTVYSREKYERLDEVKLALEEYEKEWLKAQAKLEELQKA